MNDSRCPRCRKNFILEQAVSTARTSRAEPSRCRINSDFIRKFIKPRVSHTLARPSGSPSVNVPYEGKLLRCISPPRDAFAVELPIFFTCSFGYTCDETSWPEDYSSLEIHLRGIRTSPLSCDARLGKMYPRFLGAFVSAIKEKREKWPMK